MYNPKSDKLTHMIKVKDEIITIPDIGNTQAYSDDESSKATKISQRMHNFIVNKTVLEKKAPTSGIKYKSKYPREVDREEEDQYIFSDDEWVLEDNGQQLISIKRNKKNDHDKNPDEMDPARSSSVSEISASTFTNSVNSKTSQKDKQYNENNNNNPKKKGNIISYNIISILRLLICYSMVFALQEATIFKDGNITVHSFLDTASLYKCKGDFYNAVPITRIENNNIKLLWLTMIVLIIGLTMSFNSYIIPTELILRILHGIKTDIGEILSWIRKEPKRDILLKTIKTLETKI
jgi:hypothetical protein